VRTLIRMPAMSRPSRFWTAFSASDAELNLFVRNMPT